MTGFGQRDRADAPLALHDQYPALVQVGGEEHREQDLGELARLEVDRPHADPDACAAAREPHARHHRQQQQADAEGEGGVLVAAKVAGARHQPQRGHERADTDEGPRGLQATPPCRQPRDHHPPEPVQERSHRQDHRVGTARQHAHRHVREHQQSQHEHEEHPDARRQRGVAPQRGEHVGGRRDQPGQQHHAQLGAAPGGGDGCVSHRWSWWWCRPWWWLRPRSPVPRAPGTCVPRCCCRTRGSSPRRAGCRRAGRHR